MIRLGQLLRTASIASSLSAAWKLKTIGFRTSKPTYSGYVGILSTRAYIAFLFVLFNMQRLLNILAFSVAVVSGTQTPEALVLTFGDTHLPHSIKSSAISGLMAQQILDLRMETDTLSSGGPDQDTIETLNDLGGRPVPLFSPGSEADELKRNLLVLEGLDPEIGMTEPYPWL